MNDLLLRLNEQSGMAAAGYVLIALVTAYVMLKSAVWWMLFGTGRLLVGKYSIVEWGKRTLYGIVAYVGLILLNAFFLMGYTPDNWLYTCLMVVTVLLAVRVAWREVFSLFGLLRGDWNPFAPELRFVGVEELLEPRPKAPKRKKSIYTKKQTVFGSYADYAETVMHYQHAGVWS